MAQPKTMKSPEPITSRLFPIYEVQGHGSHWRPVMRTGRISTLWKQSDDHDKEAILETFTYPERPYKDWARSYIETIEKLQHMPGASDVCEDLEKKVAVRTVETFPV